MKFSLVLLLSALTTASYASYEVWGCDQSNSVPDQDAVGVKGSFLWIWDDDDIEEVIKTGVTPQSKSCTPDADSGPCDLMQML